MTFDAAQLRSTARAWVLKLASGEVTESDLEALQRWVDSSPEQKAAFERARALWQATEVVEDRFAQQAQPKRVSYKRTWAMAAAVAAIAVLPLLTKAWTPFVADYRSPVGQITRTTLQDGSEVWLDSGAALNEDFTPERRTVELISGRAFFKVAHNAQRPFSVVAGKGTATAVGTAYSVAMGDDEVVVAVEEGRVQLSSGADDLFLDAGDSGGWEDSAVLRSSAIAAHTYNQWRLGRITIQGQSLATAVAEFDRYYPGIILVRDQGDVVITGHFQIADLDGALQGLAQSQGLQVTHWGPWITVLSQ